MEKILGITTNGQKIFLLQNYMNKNRNLIHLIIVTLLGMGLTMVSTLILARLLSVDDRGAHQLFITSVSYAVTFATGGVGFSFALSMRNQQYWGWRKIPYRIFIISLNCLYNRNGIF